MEKQEYSMYEIITMTPGMAGEVFRDEICKKNRDKELIKNLLQHSCLEDVNLQDFGSTALMWASSKGHREIVQLLLERPEIDFNHRHVEDGTTALMWASYFGHSEIAKGILERPEIDVNLQNREGYTALMVASEFGSVEIVRMLLKRPEIDVHLENSNGETALMLASDTEFFDIVCYLESHSK